MANNKDLDDLIKLLLEKDPNKQIGLEKYFSHPFSKIVDNKENTKEHKLYKIVHKNDIKLIYGQKIMKIVKFLEKNLSTIIVIIFD